MSGALAREVETGRPPPRLDLDENLALMAGAGAGKTYSLVTICLHLLGGARREAEPLRTSELCLLTFTDKAAGELRTRLRERLDALTLAANDRLEPELRTSFASLGRGFPAADTWRRIRDDLGAAAIGTFHSLCVQLLRRAPAGFGVDPSFDLLDERDAQDLIRDCAERVVLQALETGDPHIGELCREMRFTGAGGRVLGVVEALLFVLQKVREEGVSPEALPISRLDEARSTFEFALREVRVSVNEALNFTQGRQDLIPLLNDLSRLLDKTRFETFKADWPRLRALADETKWPSSGKLGTPLTPFRRYVANSDAEFPGIYAACLVVDHERAFRGLLNALSSKLDAEFRRRGVLDFSALLIRTRDLLRDHPEVRREVQERFKALLVDEFQDTNRLQLEIVTLLAEERAGGPRPLRPVPEDVLSLPLQPRFLCAVGDRKQSIYEFRGADVSVFEELAAKIEAENGRRAFLQVNRRSTPHLLDFFNRTFAQVMAMPAERRPYEVVYEPAGDDLRPHRSTTRGPWGIDRVVFDEGENNEENRDQDAVAVARRLRAILDGKAEIEHRDGSRGPVRGGDIAILLRRFTHLEAYRQALIRQGVPHRVVRGRGFYGAQEVLDLASLLSVVADPDDALSFAAVLRSPLVGVTDASLLRLALSTNKRLRLPPLLRNGIGEARLPQEDGERVNAFLALHRELRRERDRLGLRVLLQVALERTQYRVSLAGTPYAEQALANLDKLLDLAARWDDASGDLSAFARELRNLAEAEPREAQADVLDAGDPRAVQILTVHQAKGLEWPIVVVPDLNAQPKNVNERVLYDRSEGLSIKAWVPGWVDVERAPRHRRVAMELSRREEAERRRLLYVALTRAREHLVLTGFDQRRKDTWWAWLNEAIKGSEEIRRRVTDVKEVEAKKARQQPFEFPQRDPKAIERVDAAIARVRSPKAPAPKVAVFPVTHLQDYSRCPRRYHYAHVVGLSDSFATVEFDEPSGGEEAPGPDPRRRGTMAHRLLERADLGFVLKSPALLHAHLEDLLRSEGVDPQVQPWAEVITWAEGFLRTPFGKQLAQAEPWRVHRELPFLLRLPAGPSGLSVHLKGQIDLLFEDDDGGATIIDYKSSVRHGDGLGPYAFQLDCYALAARGFIQEGVGVRTGIAFLRESDPGPDMRAPDLAAGAEGRLVTLAETLLQDVRTGIWEGRAKETCLSLGCGYRSRCHGGARGL